jgi:hypothetical protein
MIIIETFGGAIVRHARTRSARSGPTPHDHHCVSAQSRFTSCDLLAATAALARTAGRGPQLTQSSSINKAAFHRPYLLIPRTSLN